MTEYSPPTSDLCQRDGALVENWYIACLSRELGRGKPLKRIVYDTPLVLFRGESGRPACLPDRCLHRHAQLSKGAVLSGGKLACPYHGWVYDSQGTVVEVPSEGEKGKCPHADLKLKSFTCVEQDGAIWVWMGEGEPVKREPSFRFPHLGESGWASYFMITDFENEVTHLAENFMDVPHTVFVHRGWFRKKTSRSVPISVRTETGSVLVTYDQAGDSIGFTGRILNPRGEKLTHTDRFILPNLTRVDYGFGERRSFVIISQCTPVTKLETRVYTAIIYRLGRFGAISHLLKPFFRFYTRQVIEQDVDIMKIQGDNFRHDMTCRFHTTGADIVHTAIEKLRDLAMRGDPESHTFQDEREETIWI